MAKRNSGESTTTNVKFGKGYPGELFDNPVGGAFGGTGYYGTYGSKTVVSPDNNVFTGNGLPLDTNSYDEYWEKGK